MDLELLPSSMIPGKMQDVARWRRKTFAGSSIPSSVESRFNVIQSGERFNYGGKEENHYRCSRKKGVFEYEESSQSLGKG